MAEGGNHLEIDSKPSVFASMVDSSEKEVERVKDWPNPAAAAECVIPVDSSLFAAVSNVKTIRPNQGICIKTKTDKNVKIFINICHHSAVPHPSDSFNINDIINHPGESLFHFPLSLGELRSEKDRSGNDCKCLDVVINSGYYHKKILKVRERDFILNLVSSSLKQKYDITIDIGSYKILTKHYHCIVHDHFIRVEPQTDEKKTACDDITADDRFRLMLDSNASMISSLIEAGAKYSDLKEKGIVDVTDASVYTEDDNIGMEKMCQLFDSASIVPIKPNPGICAKGKTSLEDKIFINLCHHNAIAPPSPTMNVELIMKRQQEIEFPLSLGELRVDKDKSGSSCRCYDVVVNSDYYHAEIAKKEQVREYFFLLACTGVRRNYNISVDTSSLKILTKPYHGKMPEHFLRFIVVPEVDKGVIVEGIAPADNILMPAMDSSQLVTFPSPKIKDYTLFPKKVNGKSLLLFQGIFTDLEDKRNVVVFVSKHLLTIEDNRGNIIIKVPIPSEYTIDPEKSITNFWNNRLTVAMPIKEENKI